MAPPWAEYFFRFSRIWGSVPGSRDPKSTSGVSLLRGRNFGLKKGVRWDIWVFIVMAHKVAVAYTTFPKGPNLEKKQSRLKLSISLEDFNLGAGLRDGTTTPPQRVGPLRRAPYQSRLKFSIPSFRVPPQNCLAGWLA